MTWLELIHTATEIVLATALALSLWRVLRGPSAYDRVLGLELIALVFVGFLVLEARWHAIRLYLDAALALALFSFVGTVLLARILEEGSSDG